MSINNKLAERRRKSCWKLFELCNFHDFKLRQTFERPTPFCRSDFVPPIATSFIVYVSLPSSNQLIVRMEQVQHSRSPTASSTLSTAAICNAHDDGVVVWHQATAPSYSLAAKQHTRGLTTFYEISPSVPTLYSLPFPRACHQDLSRACRHPTANRRPTTQC